MAKMLEHHLTVLRELDDRTQPHGEMCSHFAPIVIATGMSRAEVRRIVRHLARKGFAEYWSGLWTECGERPAGAGYCITPAGREEVAKHEAQP